MTENQTPAPAENDTQRSAGLLSFEAELAERFADPEWVAKWNAAEDDARPFVEMLNALRAEEGDSVTLLCDNPDFNGQPNNAIECCGDWTNWQERRFTGDTLRAAVLAAYRAKKAAPPAESGAAVSTERGEGVRLSSTDEPSSPAPAVSGVVERLKAHAADDRETAVIQRSWVKGGSRAEDTAKAYDKRAADLLEAAAEITTLQARVADWKFAAEDELQRRRNLRDRVAELTRERDALLADRDCWRRLADGHAGLREVAEAQLATARKALEEIAVPGNGSHWGRLARQAIASLSTPAAGGGDE